MRLSKELIKQIADAIANNLESKGMVTFSQPKHIVAAKVAEIIMEDMAAEDRLNREVENILRSHEGEIAKGGMDYRKLFELTKQKLARERKMVI
jgi:hypothetical protein